MEASAGDVVASSATQALEEELAALTGLGLDDEEENDDGQAAAASASV